ncbi:MAG: right-handed parallel beta-helix repeat-containing protein, partial [Anaerolineae bacterium]
WGDPAFVDSDAGDYHIAAGSAAVDAGSYPTLEDDVDGESRPADFGPDIGADERPGPGLRVVKDASHDVLSPGQTVTYTLVVTGIGTGPVNDIVLVDRLPPEQRLIAGVAETGACTPLAAPVWGGGLTCTLGALNVGQSARITLTAQVTTVLPPAFPWQVRNSAWATGTQAAGFAAVGVHMQDCHVRLNDEPGEWDNVQAAVDASTQPGDVVQVAGYCAGASSRSGTVQMLRLDKTLTLQGGWNTSFTQRDALSFPTTLDALGQGRVLYVAPPLGSAGNISPTLEGLRITGGAAGDPDGLGGGMYLSRTAALIRQTRVFSNSAEHGGGLYLINSDDANLVENAVFGNAAVYGGGLYLRDSAATLDDNVVYDNIADSGGGLFLRYSPAVVRDNTVSGNTAHVYGGGVYLNDSAATLSGNAFSANTSYYGAGGLYLIYGALTLSGNTISDNVAKTNSGGGLWLSESEATLNDNVISGNAASSRGGGLYLTASPATLNGNAVFSNTASQGGGLNLRGSDARLNDNAVSANTADEGGGLYLLRSDAALTNTVITDNRGDVAGSGLYIFRSFPRLWHTTVARNTGFSGIYVANDYSHYSSVAMTNTILMGHGVGISVTQGNTVTLESTLWYSNSSDWEGAGALFTGTHNYRGDPRFDASGYRLLPGSAAIDKGVNAGVTSDIDGNPRSFGPAPDLGASEAAAILAIHKTGPATAEPGQAITYTLRVTNSGVYTASAVVISDALPVGAHYVGGGTLLPGDVVGWSLGSLAGGAQAQAQFVVTATETVVNSVYGVTCAEGVAAQGAEVVVTTIGETPALLSISKTGPAAVAPGAPITYTLTIINHGAAPLTNLVISDTLPVGAEYVSGGTLLLGDVVSWTVASLAEGGTQAQVQFVVTAMETIINEFYGVTCAEGISATGSEPVVTVSQQWTIYLPVAMKGE